MYYGEGVGGPPSLKHCFGDLLDISLPYRIREPVLTQAPAISAVHPPQMYRVGMVIIGALIISIGFGVYYTLNMIRNPQSPFLIIKAATLLAIFFHGLIKAATLLAISPHGPCKLMVQRTPLLQVLRPLQLVDQSHPLKVGTLISTIILRNFLLTGICGLLQARGIREVQNMKVLNKEDPDS